MDEKAEAEPPKHFLSALIAAVLLALLIVGWGSWKESEYVSSAKQHAAENAWHADKDVEYRCAPKAPLDKRNCAIEARREQANYTHDQQDLAAQQTSALWTAIMGGAAVFGVVLSVLGVWLVYTTFGETRAANEIARTAAANASESAREQLVEARRAADAAHDANRPWIELGLPTNVAMYFTAHGVELAANVGFTNRGKSPATNVLIRAELIAVPVKESGVGDSKNPRRSKEKVIVRADIEASLDRWEEKHADRGWIAYPGKPESGIIDKVRDLKRTHTSDALGYLVWALYGDKQKIGEVSRPLF